MDDPGFRVALVGMGHSLRAWLLHDPCIDVGVGLLRWFRVELCLLSFRGVG